MDKQKTELIRIPTKLKRYLDSRKLIPREPYGDVLKRLLGV